MKAEDLSKITTFEDWRKSILSVKTLVSALDI